MLPPYGYRLDPLRPRDPSGVRVVAPLASTRPGRSGGAAHTISVDPDDLCPVSCTCPAGQRGVVCHAVLALAAGDDLKLLACSASSGRRAWPS
jgi:hypothetical protein